MTRWSLRRRHGVTKDAEREYRPVTAAPPAGRPPAPRRRPPAAGPPPPTAPPPAGPPAERAQTGQPGPGPQNGGWFSLAGRSEEELAGFTISLLDIIRMAASAIERYTQVTIGPVTDLAVLGYAADDIGSLMAALLDNATRYSPGTVTYVLTGGRTRTRHHLYVHTLVCAEHYDPAAAARLSPEARRIYQRASFGTQSVAELSASGRPPWPAPSPRSPRSIPRRG